MTTKTATTTSYDHLPKFMRFDDSLCSLSASPSADILVHLHNDDQSVIKDMVYHHLPVYHRCYHQDATDHIKLEVYEYFTRHPDKLRAIIEGKTFRYYLTGICRQQLKSESSSWYRTYIRPNLYRVDNEALIDLPEEEPTDQDTYHQEHYKLIIDRINNILKGQEWYMVKLWEIYYLDSEQWLQEARKSKPSQKMSYRFIAAKTKIPYSTIQSAIAQVNSNIKEEYESTYGTFPHWIFNYLSRK